MCLFLSFSKVSISLDRPLRHRSVAGYFLLVVCAGVSGLSANVLCKSLNLVPCLAAVAWNQLLLVDAFMMNSRRDKAQFTTFREPGLMVGEAS